MKKSVPVVDRCLFVEHGVRDVVARVEAAAHAGDRTEAVTAGGRDEKDGESRRGDCQAYGRHSCG